MSTLHWSEGDWKPYGKDLETALQSQEARSCTELALHNNHLSSLPDCIGRLTNLTKLFLHNNQLLSLPDCIGSLTNLTILFLHNNRLKSLPRSMGNLKKLETLRLGKNSALPQQFHKNLYDHSAAQDLISDISIYYHKCDAARRAALFITARYGEGDLAVFPRDLIKLIAKEVWKTRSDDAWMGTGE